VNSITALPGLGLNDHPRYFFFRENDIIQALALQGWPDEARSDPRRAEAAARDTLARWLAVGLPVRYINGRRAFDIGHVLNFMRLRGLEGRDTVFTERTIPNGRRDTARAMTVPPPTVGPSLHTPRRFRVIHRREFDLTEHPPGKMVRLRVPLPYDDPSQRDIQVSVRGSEAGAAIERLPGRLEVRLDVATKAASLETDVTFTAFQQRGGIRDFAEGAVGSPESDVDLYLRPREGLIHLTPAVRQLATEIAGRSPDPESILKAFWRFLFCKLKNGYLHHAELDKNDPLIDIVRRGWFDCLGGTSLFIALCRARGIRARLIHGIILHELTPAFHFWAEVYLPSEGWIPVDLMCWDHAEGRLDRRPWSHLFLGKLEYRLKCQCFPRLVVGPPGVRFPSAWSMLLTPAPGGTTMSIYNAITRRALYRDTLTVVRIEA
jgi:Transglutaminase-like superfamily